MAELRARKSLTDEITANLSSSILNGELKPGAKLPTGQQLAQDYGVSLTVVRESVSRLLADGLVTSRQGAGVFVANNTMRRPFRIEEDTIPPAQIFELRTGMEITASGLAAERRSKKEMDAVVAAHEAMIAAAQSGDRAVSEDLEFHLSIARATGNPLFERFTEFLAPHIDGSISTSRRSGGQAELDAALQEHEKVAEAIVKGDKAAAEMAMTEHMLNCRSRVA